MNDDHPNKQYRDMLIDHLQRNGWFEPAEPFILSTKTAERGIEAIHEAKQLVLRAIHPYNANKDNVDSKSRRNSELIVTLDAVMDSLRPVVHGEDPKSLMFDSFGHKDPRTHGEFSEGVNAQIVAAVDCMKRHCPEIKNPSAHVAVILKRLGVPKKSERTVRNMWKDRREGYAYDNKDFRTLFWIRVEKRTYNRTIITQSDIETALKESIKIFQVRKRARDRKD